MLKSLLREPLVHFLLLGAALFLLDAWLRPATPTPGTREIVVSEARVRNLVQSFSRTWLRPPTPQELEGLVDSHIREEVLYREALALGLDRDDTIIRRRLQQKMEFVSEQAAALAEPTDAELGAYLKANPDAFRLDPRVSFVQVHLDPGKRAATLGADAKRLLDRLNGAGDTPDLATLGDRLALLDARYEDVPQAEVARLFGSEFAESLVKQPVGQWVGPIKSGYGAHLVRIDALQPGGIPALDEVRPLVEREWSNWKRQDLAKGFYEDLRAKYRIKVQMPEVPKP